MEHLLACQPRDVLLNEIANTVQEISFDNGKTFAKFNNNEIKNGFQVPAGSNVLIRVTKPGLFPAVQGLTISEVSTPTGIVPATEIIDPRDFSTFSTFEHNFSGNQVRHVITSRLSLFRDGSPDRIANQNTDPPPFVFNMLDFNGINLLSNGTGTQRFAAQVQTNSPSMGAAGKLLFVKTTNDSKFPHFSAVFIPAKTDLSQPVSINTFFTPSTGKKARPYPFSGDFNAVFGNFLTGGTHRLVNQHVLANKNCLLVFPLTQPDSYFLELRVANGLRNFLIDLVYFLQRTQLGNRFLTPQLGFCSVSGFSEAGDVLFDIMKITSNNEFPELQELYGLDVVVRAGVAPFIQASDAWLKNQPNRKMRLYSHFQDWLSFGTHFSPAPIRSLDGAKEFQSANVSFLFTPLTFWQHMFDETNDKILGYFGAIPDDSVLHQVMPGIFLEHGLKNSGFPN